MIPLELQDGLKLRMKRLFEHFRLKNSNDVQVPINIFTQHLPNKSKQQVDHFPCITIRLDDGAESGETNPQMVKVLFIVGVVDRDSANQGYRDVVGIIQKIYQDLKRNPVIDEQFVLSYPIHWAYHDEDAHPHYFAGLETNWEVPKIIREDLEEMV